MPGSISIPITLVDPVVAFGSLVGCLHPLGARPHGRVRNDGVSSRCTSQIVPMDESISEVILLIGLAVGVDYSLFYIRRERDERRGRAERTYSSEAAAATPGRAVLDLGHHGP